MSDVGGFSEMEVDSPGPQPIPPIIRVLSDGKSVLIDHESKKQLILPGKNLWKIGERKGCHTLECLSDQNISARYVSKALESSKATDIDENIPAKTKATAASPTAKIRKTAKAPRSDSEEETSDDKDKENDKTKKKDKEKDDKMKDKENDKMKDKESQREKKKTPKQEAADMSESKGSDSKDKHNKGNGGTTEVPEKVKDSDDEGPVQEAVDISS